MYYSSITDIVCFPFTSCFPCFGDGVPSFDVVVVVIFVSLAESRGEWFLRIKKDTARLVNDGCDKGGIANMTES